MFHQPPKNFLYSAYRINVDHSDGFKTMTGVATGFILEIAKGVPWIVTNRHVVDRDYKQPTAKFKDFKLSKFTLTGRRQDDKEYTLLLHENATFYVHEDIENDIVIIRAHCYLEETQTLHWHFGIEHLASTETFKTIEPFDLICYSGFPQAHDKLNNRPILRSGNIASDPKYDYSWNSNYQGQCVAYEGFSSEGASGSPVFAPPRGMTHIDDSRTGYLVGINAGHIPDSYGHSGISYFYKSTAILEIIERNKLTDVHKI